MKNSLLFILISLVSCSHFTSKGPVRFLASVEGPRIEVKVSPSTVFANGADFSVMEVVIKDEKGQVLKVDPSELRLVSDVEVGQGRFIFSNGAYETQVRPKVKSPDVRMFVVWKDLRSDVMELKTTLKPMKDKMSGEKRKFVGSETVAGITFKTGGPKGKYEGFSLSNNGDNSIVDACVNPHSSRTFDFDYEDQAAQNLSLMVQDSPNEFTSHTMLSHFMFFPRNYLPVMEIQGSAAKVTLPTGELLVFDKESGEIVDGVFKEGPVDVGPDRFKRTYADLRYQGKGILLRANARGQMPQQGQFESTKIDMDHGIKYSADVLIINGTTGERCRRPKSDFWPSQDVSPIPFKFPTDKEFDAYLRSKCGFGIPNLEVSEPATEDSGEIAREFWKKCEDYERSVSNREEDYLGVILSEYLHPVIRQCLNEELADVEDVTLRRQVIFDLYPLFLEAREEEHEELEELTVKEVTRIKKNLLKEAAWISDFSQSGKVTEDCIKALPQTTHVVKYHTNDVFNGSLQKMCTDIRSEMKNIILDETTELQDKIQGDFSWLSGALSGEKFLAACKEKGLSFIDNSYRYHKHSLIYSGRLEEICSEVETSSAYREWLGTQVSFVEEKVYSDLTVSIEKKAEKQAEKCLVDFPVDTSLNRVRYKSQRESCLIDDWIKMEEAAIDETKKDPMVSAVNLSYENIRMRLEAQRRRLQLKVIKKFFL